MSSLLVRNLPDNIHEALRTRAASHRRSTEAEVREILTQAVSPNVGLATYAKQLRDEISMTGAPIEFVRSQEDVDPAVFD